MDHIWRSAPVPVLCVHRIGGILHWSANEPARAWAHQAGLTEADWEALASAGLERAQPGGVDATLALGADVVSVRCRAVRLDDGSALLWLLVAAPASTLALPAGALVGAAGEGSAHREASEFLGRAVVLADVSVWRIDIAANRVYFNVHGYRQLGLEPRPDGIDLDEVRELIHPDDRPGIVQGAADALASDRVIDVIGRYRGADGGWRTLLTRRVAYRDPQGKPFALAGVSLDLSELVAEREQALRLRERMDLLAGAVGLGIWSRDVESGVVEWNDQMYRLHRRSMAEGPPDLHEWLNRHVHPLDRARLTREQAETEAAWAPDYQSEFRIPADDGGVRWISTWARREVRDGRRMVFGVQIDITERRKAEQQAQRERARAQFAIDAAGMGAWERGLDGMPLYWSERMYTMRGLDPSDPRPLAELAAAAMGEQEHGALTDLMVRRLVEGDPYEQEFEVRWPDGSVHWLMARGQLVRDDAGRPLHYTGVNWDITERKRAEAALQEAQRAEQASRAKSEFMARMSHELRTPLNAVLGFAQLMARDPQQPPSPRQRERLDFIRSAGEHLLALIDDVLQLARIEADPRPAAAQPVLLDAACREAAQWLSDQAQRHHVSVQWQSTPLPGLVMGVRRHVGQIVTNLISNAIKYNRPGGWVRVASQADTLAGRPAWRVSVSDSGHGLDAAQLQRLFEPFERLGAELHGIEGTGIGLTIVRQLVERMQGRIEVHSRVGEGTRFDVWLPAADPALLGAEADRADPGVPPEVAPPPAGALKLLCIEDNPVNMLLVREVLALRPWVSFQGAELGEQGVALAQSWQPDVVLLDLQLPDVPGTEVLQRVRRMPALNGTRVVALSANAMPQDVQAALDAGFDDYWTKPIEIDDFLGRVDALVAAIGHTTVSS
jgi:PAS domain S-box-containing protein